MPIPGWAQYASVLHAKSRAAYKDWVAIEKPRSGKTLELKKIANAKLKNAVCYIKRNDQRMWVNSLANKPHHKSFRMT